MSNRQKLLIKSFRVLFVMATVFVSTAFAQRATADDVYDDSVSGQLNLFHYIVLLILGVSFFWGVIKVEDFRSAVFKYVWSMAGILGLVFFCNAVFGKEWAIAALVFVVIVLLMRDPSFGGTEKQENKADSTTKCNAVK